MTNLMKNFIADESGATAIEYGLIAALVSIAIISILTIMGGSLETTFTKINTELTTANAA